MEKQHTPEKQYIHVACVGNPNCGKTTLFNALTGSRLKVANWPGVTVEKVEGRQSMRAWESNWWTRRAFIP